MGNWKSGYYRDVSVVQSSLFIEVLLYLYFIILCKDSEHIQDLWKTRISEVKESDQCLSQILRKN